MKNQTPEAAKEIFVYSVLDSIRRRKYQLLIPTLIITAVAALYALAVSPVYRSEALLRAEPMVTVHDFVDATGASHANHVLNIDEHFRNIQQIVLSEALLTTVAREFRLYQLVNGKVPDASLQEMKKRVMVRIDGGDELRHNEPRFVSFWVGFEGGDRKQSMDVANRIADLFIKEASDVRERRVKEIVSFIQTEMTPLQKKLDVQGEKIKAYKQGASASLPEHASANLRLLEGLQMQFAAKTENIAKDDARRSAIVQELHELEKQGALETVSPPEEKPEIVKKLDDLRMQYQQMQARYAVDHPELRRIRKEIAEVEQMVPQPKPKPRAEHSPFYLRYVQLKSELEELDRRASSYQREQADLAGQIAAYRSRVDSAPAHESELADMVREYTATQTQYQEMLDRQHNARLAEHFEKLSKEVVFRVVDPARIPLSPVRPQRARIILFGLFGGLGLGIVLAFFSEQMDSSFASVDDYQRACDIPLLATVPSLAGPTPRDGNGSAGRSTVNPMVVTLSAPQSIPAEQYRILAMKLLARNGGPSHVFAVTSSAGGEGKTITAINLAVALASERKVLLVDADLRRPRVHEFLKVSRQGKGFADLLAETGELKAETYIRKVGDLYVIPGVVHRTNPTGLLASRRAADLFQMLRTQFQFVIIDSPPILPIADSILLSSFADEVFLVLRARRTPRELFQHAVENLDTANIRGVVLNDVDFQHSRYAHAYRYYRKNYLER